MTAVHSNCSGNHAAMLALSRHHGWPVEFYTRAEHPVQQRCLGEVSAWTGVPVQAVGTAVDGCGVVCFALPLRNMAWAYARLSNAERGMRNAEGGGEVTPHSALRIPHSDSPYSAFRIVEAMLRHPELVAGAGRPCTEMMRAHPGRVVAKVGAAGVYCGLLTREGCGIALKVEDGHGDAAVLAMSAILAELGVRPQPETLRARPIVNTRGETVGELRVNGGLTHAKDAGESGGTVYYA
jgi:L-asparaginase II